MAIHDDSDIITKQHIRTNTESINDNIDTFRLSTKNRSMGYPLNGEQMSNSADVAAYYNRVPTNRLNAMNQFNQNQSTDFFNRNQINNNMGYPINTNNNTSGMMNGVFPNNLHNNVGGIGDPRINRPGMINEGSPYVTADLKKLLEDVNNVKRILKMTPSMCSTNNLHNNVGGIGDPRINRPGTLNGRFQNNQEINPLDANHIDYLDPRIVDGNINIADNLNWDTRDPNIVGYDMFNHGFPPNNNIGGIGDLNNPGPGMMDGRFQNNQGINPLDVGVQNNAGFNMLNSTNLKKPRIKIRDSHDVEYEKANRLNNNPNPNRSIDSNNRHVRSEDNDRYNRSEEKFDPSKDFPDFIYPKQNKQRRRKPIDESILNEMFKNPSDNIQENQKQNISGNQTRLNSNTQNNNINSDKKNGDFEMNEHTLITSKLEELFKEHIENTIQIVNDLSKDLNFNATMRSNEGDLPVEDAETVSTALFTKERLESNHTSVEYLVQHITGWGKSITSPLKSTSRYEASNDADTTQRFGNEIIHTDKCIVNFSVKPGEYVFTKDRKNNLNAYTPFRGMHESTIYKAPEGGSRIYNGDRIELILKHMFNNDTRFYEHNGIVNNDINLIKDRLVCIKRTYIRVMCVNDAIILLNMYGINPSLSIQEIKKCGELLKLTKEEQVIRNTLIRELLPIYNKHAFTKEIIHIDTILLNQLRRDKDKAFYWDEADTTITMSSEISRLVYKGHSISKDEYDAVIDRKSKMNMHVPKSGHMYRLINNSNDDVITRLYLKGTNLPMDLIDKENIVSDIIQITSEKDPGKEDGVYIYNVNIERVYGEYSSEYIFIPMDKLINGGYRRYGFGINREEAIHYGNHEYQEREMKKRKEERNEQREDIKYFNDEKRRDREHKIRRYIIFEKIAKAAKDFYPIIVSLVTIISSYFISRYGGQSTATA